MDNSKMLLLVASWCLSYKGSVPIYLEQLGRVLDGVENAQVASWYNDGGAIVILLTIQRQLWNEVCCRSRRYH
jgi:hypothetical protein